MPELALLEGSILVPQARTLQLIVYLTIMKIMGFWLTRIMELHNVALTALQPIMVLRVFIITELPVPQWFLLTVWGVEMEQPILLRLQRQQTLLLIVPPQMTPPMIGVGQGIGSVQMEHLYLKIRQEMTFI